MHPTTSVGWCRSVRIWSDSCSAEVRLPQTLVVIAGDCGSHSCPKGHAQPCAHPTDGRIEVQQHVPEKSRSWICTEDISKPCESWNYLCRLHMSICNDRTMPYRHTTDTHQSIGRVRRYRSWTEVRKNRWLREHASDHEERSNMTKEQSQNMKDRSQTRNRMWFAKTEHRPYHAMNNRTIGKAFRYTSIGSSQEQMTSWTRKRSRGTIQHDQGAIPKRGGSVTNEKSNVTRKNRFTDTNASETLVCSSIQSRSEVRKDR